MGYDPSVNQLRPLVDTTEVAKFQRETPQFLFTVGEELTVKGVVFRVHEIGDTRLILKPVKAA